MKFSITIYVQDNKENIIAYELYKIIRTFSNDFDIINTSLHLSKNLQNYNQSMMI